MLSMQPVHFCEHACCLQYVWLYAADLPSVYTSCPLAKTGMQPNATESANVEITHVFMTHTPLYFNYFIHIAKYS